MRISSYSFVSILLKLHRCFVHGLKICMWFGYNHEIIFYHFFCKLNLVIFQALLLSTYVDNIYLVRVTTPMNFTFSDDSLKKFLAGDINSLNLLVYHRFGQQATIHRSPCSLAKQLLRFPQNLSPGFLSRILHLGILE